MVNALTKSNENKNWENSADIAKTKTHEELVSPSMFSNEEHGSNWYLQIARNPMKKTGIERKGGKSHP